MRPSFSFQEVIKCPAGAAKNLQSNLLKNFSDTAYSMMSKRKVIVMKAEISEILKQLEERMARVDREELLGLLVARTKHHHNYSLNNMLLAGFQLCEQQGRDFCFEVFTNMWLAPFPVWNRWGYKIRKGSKALSILIPIKYKRQPKTRKTVQESQISDQVKDENRYYVYFTTRCVFDVSQTEKPGSNENAVHRELSLDHVKLSFQELLLRVLTVGIKVEFLPLNEDTGGYIAGNTITINSYNSAEAQYGTLLHEIGHYCLRHTAAQGKYDRSIEELEAESTAYVLGKMLGIEIPSELYIAAWSKNSKAVMKSLGNIDKAVKSAVGMLKIKPAEKFEE